MPQVAAALVRGDPVESYQQRERSCRAIPGYLWASMRRFWSPDPDGRVGAHELRATLRARVRSMTSRPAAWERWM